MTTRLQELNLSELAAFVRDLLVERAAAATEIDRRRQELPYHPLLAVYSITENGLQERLERVAMSLLQEAAAEAWSLQSLHYLLTFIEEAPIRRAADTLESLIYSGAWLKQPRGAQRQMLALRTLLGLGWYGDPHFWLEQHNRLDHAYPELTFRALAEHDLKQAFSRLGELVHTGQDAKRLLRLFPTLIKQHTLRVTKLLTADVMAELPREVAAEFESWFRSRDYGSVLEPHEIAPSNAEAAGEPEPLRAPLWASRPSSHPRAEGGGPLPLRRTFTECLRRFEPGGLPDEETFTALWATLKAALVAEIKKRGLWENPPSYLGVLGAERSWAGGEEEDPSVKGPIEDLVADCYALIFVHRLQVLMAQLAVKSNVDGLVFLSIRQFLYERQKEHDPLGFRIYETLRTAVRQAVEQGEMVVLEGDPRIRRDTVLGLVPRAESAGAEPIDLAALVQRWNDDLLPDLITAHGRGRQTVLGTLQRRLGNLKAQGIAALYFRELVDPLESDARRRWAALLEREVGGLEDDEGRSDSAGVLRWLQPGRRYEDREAFRALVRCIDDHLKSYEGGEVNRRHLENLWGFLRTWAQEPREAGAPLPSQRRLAQLLDVPRDRLPGLYALLRHWAEQCEAAVAGKVTMPGERRRRSPRPATGREPS